MKLADCTLGQLLVEPEPLHASAILQQLRAALLHMHERAVAHLDVKCSNVLWMRARCRAILADFSLSTSWGGETPK